MASEMVDKHCFPPASKKTKAKKKKKGIVKELELKDEMDPSHLL